MNQRTAIHVTGSRLAIAAALSALSTQTFAGTTSPSMLANAKRTDDPDGSGIKKTFGAADKFQAADAKDFGLGKVRLGQYAVFVHQPSADSDKANAVMTAGATQFTKHQQGIHVKPAIDFGCAKGSLISDHLLGSWIHEEGNGQQQRSAASVVAQRTGHAQLALPTSRSPEGTQLKHTAWPGPAQRRNQAGTMARA